MARPITRILLVEDEPEIRALARMALEKVGRFDVRACASGAEALAAAPTAGADLVLLDVMMPGMDGLATLAALRELPATASTPVVFMTAKVQPPEVASYRALGAIGVIAKPFSPMEVSAQIRRLWEAQHTAVAPM